MNLQSMKSTELQGLQRYRLLFTGAKYQSFHILCWVGEWSGGEERRVPGRNPRKHREDMNFNVLGVKKRVEVKNWKSSGRDFQVTVNQRWENRRRNRNAYWLVDVALEGSGDHKVTVRQRGLDDSISEVQHVHCLIYHIPHLRKGEGGQKYEEFSGMSWDDFILRKDTNFIVLNKHFTFKQANNKGRTLASLRVVDTVA